MEQHPKKLTIYAYSDKRLETSVGEFSLPINPEQFSQNFKVAYDVKPAQGNQGVEGRFKSSGPEQLKLNFLFDGTDTVYGYTHANKTVSDQLREFRGVVYDLEGPIHQPRYLRLVWTRFSFDCVLSDLTVTYTLFDTDGQPLRAKLDCTFLNYKETERRVREEGKSSPDLTHVRKVGEEDTLPLMTHRIYGDPRYYLEVAKRNNLSTVRHLRTGATMTFLPLEKKA